jgi:SAM-dependent methyltransferase
MEREDWDRRYASSGLVWTAEPNQFVVAELSGLAPERALDLATGRGRNAVWLAGQGWRVTAVDFAETGLATARRLAAERGVKVDWLRADLRDYVPGPGVYQLVLIAYLHLVPTELSGVLHRATAALAAGGVMLVVGHDVTNLSNGTGGPQDPLVLYTPGMIAAELDGLRVARAEQVRRVVETEEGSREAIDTLVRAVRPLD